MRVGHIVSVKKHPDADTLFVEEVNVGEGECEIYSMLQTVTKL